MASVIDAGNTQAVATVTAASTPIASWHTCGMNERVQMLPPSRGFAISVIFGYVFFATSPRPIRRPVASRNASSFAFSSWSAFNCATLSYPVRPTSVARSSTSGMPLSMQVTSSEPTPSTVTRSRALPVGRRPAHTEPAVSRKLILIGAAVPGAPSIRALPSY